MLEVFRFYMEDWRVVFVRQYSKIGACYPQVYLCAPDGDCCFLDIALKHVFGMELEDFEHWWDHKVAREGAPEIMREVIDPDKLAAEMRAAK